MKRVVNFLLICILTVSLMPIKTHAEDASLQLAYGDLVTYGSWNGEQLVWQVANVSDSKVYLITYDLLRTKGEDSWSRPRFSMPMEVAELDQMNEPNGFFYLGEEPTRTLISEHPTVIPVGKYPMIRRGDPTTILNTYTGSIVQKWLNEDRAGFDARVFSADEKNAILKTKMAEEQYVNTRSWEGYAFLPSLSEIEEYGILSNHARSSGVLDAHQQAVNEKIEDVGNKAGLTMSKASSPIGWGEYWWTRTPDDSIYFHMVIGYGSDQISKEVAYYGDTDAFVGAGIRPCVNLDPRKVKSKAGNGTLEAPYQLVPLGKVAPEKTITPPTEIAPKELEQTITPPAEIVPEGPENDIGTDTITDIKSLHNKNNNLGAGASPANFPIYLNGKKVALSTTPMIIEGTTYLPVRALGELLDLKVDYDEKESVAILEDTKTTNRLDLPLGYTYALHNGSIVPIDATNTTKGIPSINGKSYLPLRFVATSLEYHIEFKDNSIYITQ